jgi:pyruvate dehydrogenase E1 component
VTERGGFWTTGLRPVQDIAPPHRQRYNPGDAHHLLASRAARDVLEEGITETGSMGSFTAVASAYATHGEPMIPFFIFYSMFGFQRMGDFIWSAADQRCRGPPALRQPDRKQPVSSHYVRALRQAVAHVLAETD